MLVQELAAKLRARRDRRAFALERERVLRLQAYAGASASRLAKITSALLLRTLCLYVL